MSAWTSTELDKIGTADELRLAPMSEDGTLRSPVTIWVVRVGDDLYVRAVNGPTGKWYVHVQNRHLGHLDAGGVEKDVTLIEASDALHDDIDAAYKHKHSHYGDSIVGSTLTPKAQAATLKLVP